MAKRVIVAVAATLVLGAGLAALVFSGVWPGPSAEDRQRSLLLTTQAEEQLRSGDQDAALASLSTALRSAPLDSALRLRASIYIARNDAEAALRDANALIRRGGGLAADYSTRCWLRARVEELAGARSDCDRAIELAPALASAFGSRGIVGLKQGRHHEAWTDFNTALRLGGSDEWVAWRLFGRGIAAWERGDGLEGREDIQTALIGNPGVVAQFAQFGLGGDIIREFENAAYTSAVNPRSLFGLQIYLQVYPDGAHAAEAQTQIEEIYAEIAAEEAAGRATVPGFSLAQDRGSGPASDSFGAIAISRSSWRVAFATDYATGAEAEMAAARACNADCEAFAFRNVCAALAISPADRTRGMAWAHGRDDAVNGAVGQCRERGGRSCVAVHSQCTPTEKDPVAAP